MLPVFWPAYVTEGILLLLQVKKVVHWGWPVRDGAVLGVLFCALLCATVTGQIDLPNSI